jgi:hypothetical protein
MTWLDVELSDKGVVAAVSFGGKILKIGKMFLGPGFFCCFGWGGD